MCVHDGLLVDQRVLPRRAGVTAALVLRILSTHCQRLRGTSRAASRTTSTENAGCSDRQTLGFQAVKAIVRAQRGCVLTRFRILSMPIKLDWSAPRSACSLTRAGEQPGARAKIEASRRARDDV